MAISQSDLDALDAAIASGALVVEFDGRKLTYQNTAQLIAARDHTAKVLSGGMQNRGPRLFNFRFTTSRGD
ncbi:phage head-tail joining protein [Massilia yuzhufengensis]|uniref:GpW protein n=1 Tax=Massilia yuzhufengensis TaxID=1164594 RepID=A0A1I1VLK9_9BURK|nr:hypothetical protein [Massilia yuzhufengensis]SFD83675.1 hypothetical protein SAMN05216204_14027 [Massilia yuzhufengensis]